MHETRSAAEADGKVVTFAVRGAPFKKQHCFFPSQAPCLLMRVCYSRRLMTLSSVPDRATSWRDAWNGSSRRPVTHSCRQRTPPAWRKSIPPLLIYALPWPCLSFIHFSCNPVPRLFCNSALIMLVVLLFFFPFATENHIETVKRSNSLANFVPSVARRLFYFYTRPQLRLPICLSTFSF